MNYENLNREDFRKLSLMGLNDTQLEYVAKEWNVESERSYEAKLFRAVLLFIFVGLGLASVYALFDARFVPFSNMVAMILWVVVPGRVSMLFFEVLDVREAVNSKDDLVAKSHYVLIRDTARNMAPPFFFERAWLTFLCGMIVVMGMHGWILSFWILMGAYVASLGLRSVLATCLREFLKIREEVEKENIIESQHLGVVMDV